MSNENLRLARQVKNDEFYTRYEDIEKERERESTSAEYLFRLIGHEHDLGDGTNLGQFEVNGEGKYKRILLYREV